MSVRVLVVGAGLSGAVIARVLAEAGVASVVQEARDHMAGNCHTARDAQTGVMVHRHGPHIFHTDDDEVWSFVGRFARFRPYLHRVKATVGAAVYTLPINLHTINQFFGRSFRPEEARAFIAAEAEGRVGEPVTFEDQALRMVGRRLYEAFLEGYTRKQWGLAPEALPASILKRLPLRFSYEDNYFFHRHQGMPEAGYTDMVAAMLDHPLIEARLGSPFRAEEAGEWRHVFYSGPLDGYFDHSLGRLGYRTLDFEWFTDVGDHQGCAVMNYPDAHVPYTRVVEHKHFAPWESHAETVCHRELARDCGPRDLPYYPIRLVADQALLRAYLARARALQGVTFVGRLGTYRYLDMDVSIREALDAARMFLARGAAMPAFAVEPG